MIQLPIWAHNPISVSISKGPGLIRIIIVNRDKIPFEFEIKKEDLVESDPDLTGSTD